MALPSRRRRSGCRAATLTLKQRRRDKRMALPRRRRTSCRAATLKVFLVEAKQHREEKEETAAGQEHRGQEAEVETLKSVSLGVLPQDPAIHVLMRLPLRSLVQMRVLSTSFNAFLRSPPFPQPPLLISVKVSNAGPGLDLRAPRELIAYCPHLNTWFPLPIQGHNHSGLLSAMGGPGLLQVPSVKYSSMCPYLSALAMASAGGLMCTVVAALRPEAERQQAPPPELGADVDGYLSRYVFNYKDYHVLVFNCFTGASKRLPPPPPHYSFPFLGNNLHVHMFLDASAPGAYYVVLHDSERGTLWFSYRALRIYSSRTGCWMDGHATSAGPYPCTFGDIQKSDLFSYRCLPSYAIPYYLAKSSRQDMLRSDTLFAYTIHSDSWLSIPISHVEERGIWDYVFKWQGRVLLASSPMVDAGFKVCALTSSSRWSNSASWLEVARTPASLLQSSSAEYIDVMTFDVKFVLCGNLVCMTGSYSRTVGYHRNFLRPLVYDLAEDSWYYLPPPCIKGTTTDFGVGLLAVQPHLQATP